MAQAKGGRGYFGGLMVSSSQAWKAGALKVCLCSRGRVTESLWCGCACGFPGSLRPWILHPLSEVRAQLWWGGGGLFVCVCVFMYGSHLNGDRWQREWSQRD